MPLLPFTDWNVDAVIADVVQQSAKQFTPDDWRQVHSVSDTLQSDLNTFLNDSLVVPVDKLILDAQAQRESYADSFSRAANSGNHWPPCSKNDELFYWYSMILFYDLLLKDGLSNYEQTNPSLTERERALIHCYKGHPPIRRGEPMYNDYIKFATPAKRVGYSNDSQRTAKSLIKSIEKVLPLLNDTERQQANNEMNTIVAKFS